MIPRPDKNARAGGPEFHGFLPLFCIIVALGILAWAGGAVRLLLFGGPSPAGFTLVGAVASAAFFGLGLFLTVRRHRRTPLYWQLVFLFMGLSSLGLIRIAHEAGRPATNMDKAWVFWSIIWFTYWSKSKQVARIFRSKKSDDASDNGRSRAAALLKGERPAEG